jgi:hypothetical protein
MKIRFTFECSRCGSKLFRPSTKWTFKDTILRKLGVTPQRCFRCRRRFYLYRPLFGYSILRALAAPAHAEAPATRQVPTTAMRTDVLWSTLLKADQREPRS